jgi:hypothetical protein
MTISAQAIPDEDVPYGGEMTIVAVLLTIVVPLLALIAALVLRAQETRQRRRRFLKDWAIASAAWMCTGWLIALVGFASIASSVGGASSCQGGIDQLVPPTYQSADGVHWTATYQCVNGGSLTKSVPASQVPGGGS